MHNKSNKCMPVARVFGVVALLVTLAGCSVNPLHKITGDVMTGYGQKENTPYVLAMTDIEMACSLGESVDPLLYSFSRVTMAPEKTGTLLQILSGICMEQRAVEEELRYLRADYNGNISKMRDARENMQRLYGITASRRVEAYQRMLRGFSYDPVPGAECPDFYTDQDEITFLLGLAAGAQAVIDNGKARGRADVPRSIAAQVERSADCVDNEKWAGLPRALQASIWVLLPDLRPSEDVDPWATLKNSRELGFERGLRTSAALELLMAENVGRDEVIEESLAYLARTRDQFQVNPEYSLPDLVGMRIAWAVSDRIWTEQYGYRTPRDQFGQTGKETAEKDDIDTEGLL